MSNDLQEPWLNSPHEIDSIQQAVAKEFGLLAEDLIRKTKGPVIVLARQVAMYLAKQTTKATLVEVGHHFGKHHTTVMHSIRRIDALRRSDASIASLLSKLLGIFAGL